MPCTGEMKNIGLNAMWKTTPRWVGAFSAAAATAVEAIAAGKKIKKTGNTLKNGNVIYFSVLSGGAGLVALRPYYVVAEGNEFEVSLTEGGTAVTFTTELKAASEYVLLTELSGGGYKRIETAFATAAEGKTEDTTEHNLKIPAGKTINAEGYWETETGQGAAKRLLGISVLTTPEAYGSEGTYTVKSSSSDMNLAEGTPAP